MEAIRNYLESMFMNLPMTAEVLKAKDELLQMIERGRQIRKRSSRNCYF